MNGKKVLSIIEDLIFEDINNEDYWKAVKEAKDLISKVKKKQLILYDISQRNELLKVEDKEIPFNDYIQKYFEEPKVELTYKSKKNRNVMTETELIKCYKRAMCL